MSEDDPGRWLEGGDVEADLLEALEATQGDFPTDAQLAAVEGSILSAIGGGGGGGGGGGSGSPTSVPPAAGASLSPAVPAALVAAALIGAGSIAFFWPEDEAPSPVLESPAVVAVANDEIEVDPPEPATPMVEPTVEPEPDRPAASLPERLDEGELLERARRRVRSSPAAALRLLRTHRSRFPDGSLSEERDALWVEALHERGRDDDARAAFDGFIRRYPGSVHRVHLRSLLTD